MATGRCLCGAVTYEVNGPLRDLLICHCVECRRWHGHVSVTTAARKDDLVLIEQRGLRWIDSPESDAHALLVRELSATTLGMPLLAAGQLLGILAVAFHLRAEPRRPFER